MSLSDFCAKLGLAQGFDGPMHALGMHVDSYNPKHCDLVQYGCTKDMISELAVFANHCLLMLKEQFHLECIVSKPCIILMRFHQHILVATLEFHYPLIFLITLQTLVTTTLWTMVLQMLCGLWMMWHVQSKLGIQQYCSSS